MLKKRNLWSIAVAVGALCTMLLAACGSTTPTSSSSVKNGGSLIDAISQEPSAVIPGQSTQTFAALVDAAIWSAPIYTNDQFEFAAGLLKEYPSGSNGDIKITGNTETITLKLRPNLKWSDGSAETSADVAFTIKTKSDPTFGDKAGFPASEITGVTTPDTTTTVISLNTIDVAFLANAMTDPGYNALLPAAHYSSMTPAQIAADFMPAVTDGPFTLSERVKGDHITVKKNPNYYQAGKPHLDQVTFKFFPDANTIVTALQAGQVDTAYFLPVTAVSTLKNIPGYNLFTPKSSPNYEALYFNVLNPILADVKVREALAIGFDVKTEISQIQTGNAVATCDDNTGTYAHEPNLIKNGYCPYGPDQFAGFDPTKAGQLLDSAGWTMGSNGVRQKNGQPLALRISTTSGRQYRLDSEQLIQAAWKNIGVTLTIDNHPSSDLFGPVLFPSDAKYAKSNDQWDVAEFENSLAPDPDTHLIWESSQFPPTGGQNLTYYSNTQVDQWEAQQLTQVNNSDRAATMHNIHAQILKDVPTVYLYSPLDLSEYKATLHSYSPDSIGPAETWNIADWNLS